jgi:hypothetical protein
MKRGIILGAVVLATLGAWACVADSNNSSTAGPGDEDQACFSNGTCNAGLVCIDNVCVKVDAGPEGGGSTADAGGVDASMGSQDAQATDSAVVEASADSGGDSGLTSMNDPMNCGTVGHVCPSGKCTAGDCNRRVFITSALYDGNLGLDAGMGGVATANTICKTLSQTAGLGGMYLAWISIDMNVNPAAAFTKSKAPYELVDGTIVASDWTALTTMNLTANINMTEKKGGPSAAAWTNTNADGTVVNSGASATNCEGFGDGNGTSTGTTGNPNQKGAPLWSTGGPVSCSTQNHLYCFEQ